MWTSFSWAIRAICFDDFSIGPMSTSKPHCANIDPMRLTVCLRPPGGAWQTIIRGLLPQRCMNCWTFLWMRSSWEPSLVMAERLSKHRVASFSWRSDPVFICFSTPRIESFSDQTVRERYAFLSAFMALNCKFDNSYKMLHTINLTSALYEHKEQMSTRYRLSLRPLVCRHRVQRRLTITTPIISSPNGSVSATINTATVFQPQAL